MHHPRILLVEDTDSVREVLSRQLEVLGGIVTALPDGDHVKRELDQTRYDLVIADLHLPNCSGFDIARFAHAKRCKVVLLSGDTIAASRDDLLTAQFDRILTKPVTLQTLKDLLIEQGLIEKISVHSKNNQLADPNAAINMQALQEQMGLLDEVAFKMLARFPVMMRPLADHMADAAKHRDMKQLVETAHSLKGAAYSAGALTLGEMAKRTQQLAEDNMIEQPLIEALLAEFARVETEINDMCKPKIAIS